VTSPAGSAQSTDLFLALTPESVLTAVEAGGLRTRPVCYPLNSFENRVYEVELEDRSRVVAKFYRPGRWREEQILEEHEFLAELEGEDVPVCAARAFPGGGTLRRSEGDIWYALFDRKGGRAPDELDDEGAERLGMLIGRVHAVGARRAARHRLRITGDSFVRDELAFLDHRASIPPSLADRYRNAALALADLHDERAAGVEIQRVHGDLHLGNVLLRDGVYRLLDFDDMAVAPPVQDLWLAVPGRDEESRRRRESLLAGYERFRAFDRPTLDLIEPLRGLRIVHYAAWLARRWHDPIFPRTWPQFGSEDYWREETESLEGTLEAALGGPRPAAAAEELTNKDFFWDWEEKS
jgi:Ser/Thr protein kinase RdoA (MazF antagonist)